VELDVNGLKMKVDFTNVASQQCTNLLSTLSKETLNWFPTIYSNQCYFLFLKQKSTKRRKRFQKVSQIFQSETWELDNTLKEE